MRRQAAEEATLLGLLVDLAERRAGAALRTVAGRTHRGEILGVGADFVAVRAPGGPARLVRLAALTSAEVAPGEGSPGPARPVSPTITIVDVLTALAADRPRVQVAIGADLVTAELDVVGADVLILRREDPPGVLYVPLDSASEVSLLESG